MNINHSTSASLDQEPQCQSSLVVRRRLAAGNMVATVRRRAIFQVQKHIPPSL
jgi:hypothetical protein